MDLSEQLKKLFPDHVPSEDVAPKADATLISKQTDPLSCIYEKRKGKPVTIIEGFEMNESLQQELAKKIKIYLGVGGTYKAGQIIIQGDYRPKIMAYLTDLGYKVKRVGG
jgi:translation initiation factor 1